MKFTQKIKDQAKDKAQKVIFDYVNNQLLPVAYRIALRGGFVGEYDAFNKAILDEMKAPNVVDDESEVE